jgi:formylglycine-generating enzyme required for sulfatase activity
MSVKLFLSNVAAILVVLFLTGCGINQTATGWEYNSDGGKFEILEYKPVDLTKYSHTRDLMFIEGNQIKFPSREDSLYDYLNGNKVYHADRGRQWYVSSFLLSDHEVTNKEYRQFIIWAKKRAAADLLAKTYPEKRLPNGNYNEDIPINWNDPVIQSELFIKRNNESFFNNSLLSYNIGKITSGYGFEQIDSTLKIYPDTTCIEEGMYPYRRVYWYYEEYDNYPVVGVNWLQANAYCEWLTIRLNEEVLLKNNVISRESLYHTENTLFQAIENREKEDSSYREGLLFPSFRLPTEAEWIIATKTKNYTIETDQFFAWDGFRLKNAKGQYLANFEQDYYSSSTDAYEFTAPVKSFPTEGIKVYDLCGNVAEWVSDSYVKDNSLKTVKGGSWADSFESLMSHKFETMHSNQASSRVGFRLAMERVASEYITK